MSKQPDKIDSKESNNKNIKAAARQFGDKKEDIKKLRNKMRLPLTITLSVCVWLIIMVVFFSVYEIKPSVCYCVIDYMSTDVYYADGNVKHFDDGDFKWLRKGDRAYIHLNIPDSVDIENAELHIPMYNAIVNVYFNGKQIYRDEYDPDNVAAHYGGRIYSVLLPNDYKNGDIMLEVTPVVNIPYADMAKLSLLPSNEGWKKLLEGRGFIFVASLSIMIMALICICYFTIRSISMKKLHIGLMISIFEIMINAWFFGSMGMFYLIVNNDDFCAKVEYYTLYIAIVPLALFIHTVMDKPLMKRIIFVFVCVYLVFYVVATFIELTPVQLNYSDMISIMHILAGSTIVMLVIAIFTGTKKSSNNYIFILRYGVLVSMICGVAELIRFNITKYILSQTWFTTHGLSAFAILVIAASLALYLISVSAEEYTIKVERKQLVELAFKDTLTGMPNRAQCYRQIDGMEKKNIKTYTMVFIDLNNLKTANDVYGHDMGDKLLKATANHIKEIFSDNGFCARWGGDEFVACVFGSEDLALKKIGRFTGLMKEEDESGSFPFEVSAACGYKCSTDEDFIVPMEAIRLADAIMYENKKIMKASAQ